MFITGNYVFILLKVSTLHQLVGTILSWVTLEEKHEVIKIPIVDWAYTHYSQNFQKHNGGAYSRNLTFTSKHMHFDKRPENKWMWVTGLRARDTYELQYWGDPYVQSHSHTWALSSNWILRNAIKRTKRVIQSTAADALMCINEYTALHRQFLLRAFHRDYLYAAMKNWKKIQQTKPQ